MINTFSQTIKISEKVSKVSIYLLVFLLPIFFLPWTINVLDFNKQVLLIVLILISLFTWLLKTLISGKLSLNLNWVHIPVLVLFLVFLFSTIFSLWPYGSFWGWPQLVSESQLTLLCLVILYFLVINIFEKKEIFYLMTLLVFSGFLVMLFGIFQLFGKFLLPFDFAKVVNFNTIGTMNSLGVFVAVLLPLIIVLIINPVRGYKGREKTPDKQTSNGIKTRIFSSKILLIGAGVLSAVLLFLIDFSIAWWLVIIGAVLIVALGTLKRGLFDSRWLVLPMFFLVLSLFFIFLKFQVPGFPSKPVEVFLTQRASFDISRETLKERPVLGSGLGTFVFDFSKYKKSIFNQSQFWNIRFKNGSSKIMDVLATTGLLGIISFLGLTAAFIFYGMKSLYENLSKEKPDKDTSKTKKRDISRVVRETNDEEEQREERLLWLLGAGVFISFIVLTIGYFLYQSNLSLDFLYFLLLAGFVSLLFPAKKKFLLKASSSVTIGVTFVFTLVFIFGLGIFIFEGQRYAAAVYYSKAIKFNQQGDNKNATEYLEKTVRINPQVDLYWRELSQLYLQRMNEVVRRTDLPQEEITQELKLFVSNAVSSAGKATDVNPKDVANWSVRGFVYQNLIGAFEGTEDWAIKSYEEATNLEPANPYFLTQKGIVLLGKASLLPQEKEIERGELLEQAKAQFKKAIEMKSDYAPARFQLAIVYQVQGKQLEAIEELEKTKVFAPFDIGLAFQLGLIYYQNEDYQKARTELERAIILSPGYSNALYFLGLTYDRLGKKEKAIEEFEKVAVLNPDNSEVKRILENLKAGKNALQGIIGEVPPTVPIKEEPSETEGELPKTEE